MTNQATLTTLLNKKKKSLYGGMHDYDLLRLMVFESIIFKSMELIA